VLGAEFDVEIVETHHRFKKDAPSGTALTIANAIAGATGRTEKDFKCGRGRGNGARTEREIGIHSVRAGGVVGEHCVRMSSLDEGLELTHRAHSRDVFARGALRAAEFLARAKPGMYGMNDVLGFQSE
jgi:4-hydroxy-tetrahydrodipicolinate reductase